MVRRHNVNNINLQIDNVDFWCKHSGNKGGMRIYWSSDIGFGQLDIIKSYEKGDDLQKPRKELTLLADTERMDSKEDKEFTKKIMDLLVEGLIVVG